MRKSTTASPEGPNRLSRKSAKWLRKTAPMQYHVARGCGIDPSQLARELSRERRSPFAAAEERLIRMARYSRTSPEAWLIHLQMEIGRARLEGGEVGTLDRYLELCAAETDAEHDGNRAQYRFRSCPSLESLDQVEEGLAVHGAAIMGLLNYLPLLRPSLS